MMTTMMNETEEIKEYEHICLKVTMN
jgi:hypothetical protein